MLKKSLLILTAATSLIIGANFSKAASVCTLGSIPAILTVDKDSCKNLSDMLKEDDQEGIVSLYGHGKLVMVPEHEKFYVVSVGIFDGVDQVRYKGLTYYIPNHELAKLMGE